MSLRRIVAIEFGIWRSGRNGGAAGFVTITEFGSRRAKPETAATFVNAQASVGWNSLTEHHGIGFLGATASADYQGQSTMGRVEAGYDLDLAGVKLSPIAGLTALRTTTPSTGEIGAKVSQSWTTPLGPLVPELKAEWLHE